MQNILLFFCFTETEVLQKSYSRYYGALLPTLVTVEKKLTTMKGKVWNGSVILDSSRSVLQKRFSRLSTIKK